MVELMKILLTAINAKYIHSNLAVYSLRAFANKYANYIKITELTINNSEEEILKVIYREKADVVAFSCYIWNIDIIKRITAELKKVQPKVKIWYGGPEVSYDAGQCLELNQGLDGIMIGEGEQTFLELASYYVDQKGSLEDIKGLAFKKSARLKEESDQVDVEKSVVQGTLTVENQLITTPSRQPLSLDVIPFPYQNMEEFKNRIIYYESSRGCPFSCSYCLSSIDKSVRLRSTELVKKELKQLLDLQVTQVKFVDRTFNCNKTHTMDILTFIKQNDNGITNFHFEISADLLTADEIEFLASLRPGQVQLEIGVQSTNEDTVNAIHRKMDFEKLSRNVERIKKAKNIHQHLDLIAGLPLEDYKSFEQSFHDVYKLKPDQLQLGFLKILKGSLMEQESKRYGIAFREKAPYEVLFTKHLDFEDTLRIKGICDMVEIYYNSAQFTYSILYLEHFYDTPMKLYRDLSEFYERKGLASISHSRIKRYELLLDFYKEIIMKSSEKEESSEGVALFVELLVMDLYLREDLKNRPEFAPKNLLQNRMHELYRQYDLDRKSTHMELFMYDLSASAMTGKVIKKEMILLFDYNNRDPLNKAAKVSVLGEQDN